MTTAPERLERRTGPIPRQLERGCSECGGSRLVYNGQYFRNLRLLAKLTLAEMARCIGGVTGAHLSQMELGQQCFGEKYVLAYERLFERRRKAGDYFEDDD